jgi:hypothetical protein
MVVVSMLIACFAFVLSLGTLYRVLELIAGLT